MKIDLPVYCEIEISVDGNEAFCPREMRPESSWSTTGFYGPLGAIYEPIFFSNMHPLLPPAQSHMYLHPYASGTSPSCSDIDT